MSTHETKQALNIADFIAEDLLAISDEDLYEDITPEQAEVSAKHMRSIANHARNYVGRQQLKEARRRISTMPSNSSIPAQKDISGSRERLMRVREHLEFEGKKLSLAARKGESPIDELSENDAQSLIEDLKELGLLGDDES